jgi:hypothetical protein
MRYILITLILLCGSCRTTRNLEGDYLPLDKHYANTAHQSDSAEVRVAKGKAKISQKSS